MKIKVLFFASARDLTGQNSLSLDFPEMTTANLVLYLSEQYPNFDIESNQIAIAVNQKYISSPVELQDGDEVAFLPPISGG